GHHRCDDGVGDKLAALFHITAVDIENVVAGNDVAFFIDAQAAVSIAVIREPDIKPLFNHKLLQRFNVGGTCVQVDIEAVGFGIDDVGCRAKGFKHSLGNIPARTVGTVKADLDPAEGIHAQADQVPDITVAA